MSEEASSSNVNLQKQTGETPNSSNAGEENSISIINFKKQLNNHSGKKRIYVCEICDKVCRCYSYLIEHLRSHTKEKPYVCNICSARLSSNYGLKSHHRLVHSERLESYSCDACGKTYTLKQSLRAHLRAVHTKERPYVCETCNKGFSQLGCLKKHRITHTNDFPHMCAICKKSFRKIPDLKVHLRVHTKEKPHECEFCKRGFSERSSLVVHRRIHTKEKPFICEFCSKGFCQQGNLTLHKRKKHPKEISK